MEVAGLAVWAEAPPETKLTDEQVPLPLSALASALPLEHGTIGLIGHYSLMEMSLSTATGHRRSERGGRCGQLLKLTLVTYAIVRFYVVT